MNMAVELNSSFVSNPYTYIYKYIQFCVQMGNHSTEFRLCENILKQKTRKLGQQLNSD